MTQDESGAAKDSLFLWSSGGIRRVQEKITRIFRRSAPRAGGEDKSAEPRRYPRLDLKLPIMYRILGEDASRIPPPVRPLLLAQSTNISPIGLCLSLAEELPPDTVLALSIHVMNPREKFSALGRVVWTKTGESPGEFLTGLQFVVIKDDGVVQEDHSRMEKLVRQLELAAEPR